MLEGRPERPSEEDGLKRSQSGTSSAIIAEQEGLRGGGVEGGRVGLGTAGGTSCQRRGGSERSQALTHLKVGDLALIIV
jgi:hypothetical protein